MDFAEVFLDAHKQHRLGDLVPLTEDLYAKFKGDECSFDEWKKEAVKLGYELNKFYVDAEHRSFRDRFFYIGEYATVSYPTIAIDWLALDLNKDQLRRNQVFKDMFEEGNYALYFFPENNSFAIDYLIRHFPKISKEERYTVFKDLYVCLETGFDLFPKEIVEEVLSSAPCISAQQKLVELDKVKDGMVTVYRGMLKNSTPLNKALSWTLSLEKAKMFSSRDRKFGEVYSGVVKLEHIIDYLPESNEEEVWVTSDSVLEVKKLNI